MAMELEFWKADGQNGEVLDFAVRTAAWQILMFFERFKRDDHVYVILRHTSRQKGEWIIWIKNKYNSGTKPAIGLMNNIDSQQNQI